MEKLAVCFTEKGAQVIETLNIACEKNGIRGAKAFLCKQTKKEYEGFTRVETSIGDWTKTFFAPGNALIFVGALGIAVRAIGSLAEDKLTDCPVIVIDDHAQFVIPLLSGHAGGANKLAMTLASLLDAIPVITTATDINDAFSVDSFAMEKRLSIKNKEGIKKVSAKALEEKKITLSIKDYPPAEGTDVIIAEETDAEYSLLLSPKQYTVGLGMKRGKDPEQLEAFFKKNLEEAGIAISDVYAICTIDIKEEEPALVALRDGYRIPILSFDAALLQKAPGEFSASAFVAQTVGVDNVCERAAILGAGTGAELVQKKISHDGMTMAIAKKKPGGFSF